RPDRAPVGADPADREASGPPSGRHEPRLLPHRDRSLQEGRDRELPRLIDRRPGVRGAGAALVARDSDRRLRLRGADLRRLLGLHGHRDRHRTPPRLLLPTELRLAVRRRLRPGLLAALAHDALALAARLRLHPVGRQPAGNGPHLPQPDAHDADRRALARRGVDVRRVGRAPRRRVGRRALVARRQRRSGPAPRGLAAVACADPDLPLRLLRVDLLPVGLVWVRVGHDRRALHRLGRAVATRHGRRAVGDCRRHRLAVPVGAPPAGRDGALLAAPRARPGDGARTGPDGAERPRPGGRGTLHLLPVLMADRPLPQLPPLPDEETRTLEQAAPPRRRARPDRDDGPPRKLASAGHALVVCVLALVIGLVLNAPGAHKNAYNKPAGWQRDVALALTGPLAGVSHALLLDRPRAGVQTAVGRSGNDDIDTDLGLPPTSVATTTPATTVPRATTKKPRAATPTPPKKPA